MIQSDRELLAKAIDEILESYDPRAIRVQNIVNICDTLFNRLNQDLVDKWREEQEGNYTSSLIDATNSLLREHSKAHTVRQVNTGKECLFAIQSIHGYYGSLLNDIDSLNQEIIDLVKLHYASISNSKHE